MQIDYSHQLVRTLGLKVFAVYFLMACAEQAGLVPITRKWLMDQMPYNISPGTVTDALRYLTSPENQMAVRVNGGWRLATALQLPLMFPLDDPKSPQSGHLGSVVVVVESEGTENLLSAATTNTGQKSAERTFGTKPTRPTSVRRVVKDAGEVEACLAALRELKIYGKKAERIADDHHITVADILAQWQAVQGQGWDNPQGMLIYMLENHAPLVDADVDTRGDRYAMGRWKQESEDE